MVNALNSENVILPAGTARIGSREYNVLMNSSPNEVAEFANIPVKIVDGAPVLLGDVARISDAFADQTNIVRVNGRRATYLAILKHSDASTLAVVDAVRDVLPQIKAAAPNGLDLKIDFDQSVFVRGAIGGVVREAIISSLLVSLMVGLFLGSWRSMVIVSTSIPLAIFSAIVGLNLDGHTINIMTLGGLALAIGMLVDDATVEVENIHRNRTMGKPPHPAPSSTAPTRSRCRRSWPRWRSASSSSRWCCWRGRRASSSRRWRSRSCWRCWPRTSCRGRWCPPLARLLMHSEHHDAPGDALPRRLEADRRPVQPLARREVRRCSRTVTPPVLERRARTTAASRS